MAGRFVPPSRAMSGESGDRFEGDEARLEPLDDADLSTRFAEIEDQLAQAKARIIRLQRDLDFQRYLNRRLSDKYAAAVDRLKDISILSSVDERLRIDFGRDEDDALKEVSERSRGLMQAGKSSGSDSEPEPDEPVPSDSDILNEYAVFVGSSEEPRSVLAFEEWAEAPASEKISEELESAVEKPEDALVQTWIGDVSIESMSSVSMDILVQFLRRFSVRMSWEQVAEFAGIDVASDEFARSRRFLLKCEFVVESEGLVSASARGLAYYVFQRDVTEDSFRKGERFVRSLSSRAAQVLVEIFSSGLRFRSMVRVAGQVQIPHDSIEWKSAVSELVDAGLVQVRGRSVAMAPDYFEAPLVSRTFSSIF